jgi:hypothetical protein
MSGDRKLRKRKLTCWISLDDGGHQLGIERAVELDLDVAELGVVVHGRERLLLGVHQDLGGAGVGAGAVHEAGHEHPRPHGLTGVPLALEIEELVGIVGEVAHGGHAGREVQEPVIFPEVGVHVPQAGEDRLALGVHHLRPRRHRHVAVLAHGLDAVAGDHDGGARPDGPGLGIEEPRVLEDERALGPAGQLAGELLQPLARGRVLDLRQLGDGALPAVEIERGPAADGSEKALLLVEPDETGSEAEPGDGVEIDRPGLASGLDLGRGDLLDVGLARGEHRQPVAGRGQQGAGEHLRLLRRPVQAEIEGGAARCPVLVLRSVLPDEVAVLALEPLLDGALPVVVPRGLDEDGDPLGVEPHPRRSLRSPASVVELEGVNPRAVGLDARDGLPGSVAREQEGIPRLLSESRSRGDESGEDEDGKLRHGYPQAQKGPGGIYAETAAELRYLPTPPMASRSRSSGISPVLVTGTVTAPSTGTSNRKSASRA